MISDDYNIDELLNTNLDSKLLKKVNKCLVTEDEINKLKTYGIEISQYSDLKEVMIIINNILNDIDEDDIDSYEELSSLYDIFNERYYYQSINK